MSVERNEDGSITIKNYHSSSAIGTMVKISNDKQIENFKRWAEECAKQIIACSHTLKETELYFLEHCEAVPLTLDDRRMKNFQLNVIANHCIDKLEHQPSTFSFDMKDEEIEEWQKEQNAMREETMKSPPEHFGLTMRGYYLPYNDTNTIFYEQAQKKLEEVVRLTEERRLKNNSNSHNKSTKIVYQDICFFFEETTEYFQSTSCGDTLTQQLVVFRGVTENDIQKHSPRFLGYITTLRDMGKLPDLIIKT